MLIKFSVGNFLSFKEEVTLDLTAEALKEKKGNLNIPFFYNPDIALLKSVCIYGHNSHGKTNLIKSYAFFQEFVLGSFGKVNRDEPIDVDSFRLNTSMIGKPSLFQVTIILKETKYRYGFKVTRDCVIEEWLYYSEPKIRENVLFHRYGQEFKELSKSWNKDSQNKVEQASPFAKDKILFLSVLISQDAIPRINSIGNWIKGNFVLSNSNFEKLLKVQGGAGEIYSDLNYRDTILKFIRNADIGFTTIFDKIDSISKKGYVAEMVNSLYEKEQKNFELYAQHDVWNEVNKKVKTVEFHLQKSESSGSIKYFIISCFLTKAIRNAQLIWIDELDASLHTDLFTMLVRIFNEPKNNSAGAQMIFTTHNTIMLNKQLRRDQIVFIHKNEFGESSLKSMYNPKNPIRIDKSVEQEYREGGLTDGVSSKITRFDTPTLFD
jgi:AAA15 family ATPase/GTPase